MYRVIHAAQLVANIPSPSKAKAMISMIDVTEAPTIDDNITPTRMLVRNVIETANPPIAVNTAIW